MGFRGMSATNWIGVLVYAAAFVLMLALIYRLARPDDPSKEEKAPAAPESREGSST
jgi:hypothetical protein